VQGANFRIKSNADEIECVEDANYGELHDAYSGFNAALNFGGATYECTVHAAGASK